MSAFKISNINDNKNSNTGNIQSISYQLNSLNIPYSMVENFLIMEKTPDYLFYYFTLLFVKENLHESYNITTKIISLDNDRTQVTLATNNSEFFNTIKKTLLTLENHFLSVINDFSCFENEVSFVQQLDKLNLFDKLKNNVMEEKSPIKKNKI